MLKSNVLRLVQLSDTHLLGENGLLHGHINTWSRTVAALSAAAHFNPDAVLITGDIADRGQNIYPSAARLFAQAQQDLQCPIITMPGNHDPAGSVGNEFNRARLASGPFPGDTIHEVAGLRIISLDSHGFGERAGWLTSEQLQWLADLLTTAAPRGSVLALHHPPIPSVLLAQAGRGLADPENLAAVLAGSDIRGIFCGHYHSSAVGALGTIPVWAAPAVSYNLNLFAPETHIQGLDTSWLSVITLDAENLSVTPVHINAPAASFSCEIRGLTREPAIA